MGIYNVQKCSVNNGCPNGASFPELFELEEGIVVCPDKPERFGPTRETDQVLARRGHPL